MNRMKNTLMSIIACAFITGFTSNNVIAGSEKEHCHSHKCDDKCDKDKNKHSGDHKCDKYHCNNSCTVNVTNIVNIINERFVTNTVVSTNLINVFNNVTNRYFTTNTINLTDTITNYVTATNIAVNSIFDLVSSDYLLKKSHVYRLYVATDTRDWTHWGTLSAKSNFVARIVIPVANGKTTYWKLVDYTPCNPRVAIMPVEPSTNAVTYIALSKGRLYRVPSNARP